MRFLALLLLPLIGLAQSNLPSSVYTDFAGTNAVITMPQGTYKLPGSAPLLLTRSGVTVDFAGCTLLVNPADKANDGFYPIQVASISLTSPTYPGGPGTRTKSHLVGSISECTTQLTMDPAEVVSLSSGERVLIWAGATPSDPVEPAAFIPATVASVDALGVITFAEPLGKNIVNYGSLAGMSNATTPSLQWKIGAWGSWPSGANFAKGFGVDHGLERFVGGMVHDVAFSNLTMVISNVTNANQAPNAMWDISGIAVQNFTINNVSIQNPHGNVIHFWRSFDSGVTGASFTGTGQNKIFNTVMSEAFPITFWGGDGLTFRDISVVGNDMVVANSEVGSDNIWFDGVTLDVTFTAARTSSQSPTIFGFNAVKSLPRISNADIHAITTGGTAHNYYSYLPLMFDGALVFPGSSLTAWLDVGSQKFPVLAGTVQINGVVYGPITALATNVTLLHGAGSRTFIPPEGIYTTGRFRVTTLGSVRAVDDTQGGTYDWNAVTNGQWIPVLPNRWHQIGPGDANLAAYLGKGIRFWFNSPSTLDATVEFEFTSLLRQ